MDVCWRIAMTTWRNALVASVVALLIVPMISPSSALAVQPDEIMPDATQEARARALSLQLRCLVCQNQSIDDSDAPLARDLRVLVRERIAAGENDQQVMDFIVARYGDFVLLKPPFKMSTLVLWLSPLVLLVIGIAMMRAVTRRRPEPVQAGTTGLSAQEQEKLDALLKRDA